MTEDDDPFAAFDQMIDEMFQKQDKDLADARKRTKYPSNILIVTFQSVVNSLRLTITVQRTMMRKFREDKQMEIQELSRAVAMVEKKANMMERLICDNDGNLMEH
jgi:uncharacterized protein YccT (UPF0319 family)